ncbi:duf1446 domain-containing protein [Fusarium coicis]|nr:duf1446 domain-containing protein [Fusarium coicis]
MATFCGNWIVRSPTSSTIKASGASNGGALNPMGLAPKFQVFLELYGITSLKVACVQGDNVMDIQDTLKKPGYTSHLDVKGRDLSHIYKPVLNANLYLSAAAWWHGWEDEHDKLAGALITGPQVVYEIQRPCYLNPDVVADIRNVQVLDKRHGGPSKALTTCIFRLFVQAYIKETLAILPVAGGGYGFGGYCGQHACMDFRIEPLLVPCADTKLRVTVGEDSQVVSPPQKTKPFSGQITHDAHLELSISHYGNTTNAPLGTRVRARSGDKESNANANVGFWAIEDDEHD